jgi:hypothetical protein
MILQIPLKQILFRRTQLEELPIAKTSHLQPIRLHLESFGSWITHYMEQLLPLNVNRSIIDIIHKFNALFYGLLAILGQKNNCLGGCTRSTNFAQL